MTTDLKSSNEDVAKSSSKNKNVCAKYVPVLNWLPKYTKFQAVSDFVAGITIGLTMIPQSISYAALAGLSSQYGLYSSFVGGFIYVLLGNIREVSIGPTSLMAILVLEFTKDMPVDFVILLGFLAGCVELTMGLLNLGFLVDFISIPVTSGFTSATSVIIIVNQLQLLLGIKYKAKNLLDNIFKLFLNFGNLRVTDTILGISCIILLLIFRKLKDIEWKTKSTTRNYLFKRIFWFLSIGRNTIIVLTTTILTYRLHFAGHRPFILSGEVKSGLPSLQLPPFSAQSGNQTYTFLDMCSHLGSGIIFVPLVAVLTNVAIAKTFASGALVDSSQEMRTLGICNILGSFVFSMPTCGAFTRSAVSSASGIQTPLAGIYSGTVTLLALSFLTPYFYYIPQSTLAAVLISAVVFMIDYKIITMLWKGSRRDAIATICTFTISLIFNVETGLLFGTVLNLIYLLNLSARPKIIVMECQTHLGDTYLLIKPDIGLYYPAADFLTKKVSELAENHSNHDMPLIIDCQRFKGVDYTAVKGVERLLIEFKEKHRKLWFLNVSPSIKKAIGILGEIKSFPIIHNEENIVEYFQDIRDTPEISRSITVPLFNELEEKSDSKETNYDGIKDESTSLPEESLSLITEDTVGIATDNSPPFNTQSRDENHETESSRL
ncbi:sodium-independent sulfate anion transporter-like [Belonocnema kinseyi]|uniref:sodium-independent sulfate anion transporter-like n=1 Tax=Belonocnema kinseyi TaxID=2817044 RepID=UPI00143DD083|nr:sodium-independent sulfate anion transporter-like [Belonocnema kinseyi]